jgi:replicative superfamily II helicase
VIERCQTLKDESIFKQVTGLQRKYPNIKDIILKKVINHSVGFHHAGMVRSDRDVVEKMFKSG